MFKKRLDAIIARFQSHNCIIIPYRTRKDKDDPLFIQAASTLNLDGIIVAGGDGSLHKVINMVMKANLDIPIGIFPSGTSNDFASHLGITKNWNAYIKEIIKGNISYVDVGHIQDEYFINVLSAGMMTNVAHEVDSRLKNTFGKVAYYFRGLGELPKFRGLPFNIKLDDHEVITENIYFMLILNSPVVASFKNISPLAEIDDGKLDLILLKQCNLPELMLLIADTLSGKLDLADKNIIYRQASKFEIQCAEAVETDVDGEKGPEMPLVVTTVEKKLKMFIM